MISLVLGMLTVGCVIVAGFSAGMTSCRREQGDSEGARKFLKTTIWFLLVAVVLGTAAWMQQ